jgi:glycosyltransferase involved in cell wall biosynthesis
VKFSIVMTVYQRVDYLLHALFTVIAQTYPHWELFILADGPHPDAEYLVQDYRRAEPRWADRITYDTIAPRKPQTFGNLVRRAGLERATGHYTVFLGHDCLLLPNYLTAHVENIEAVLPKPIVSSVEVACWCRRPSVVDPAAHPLPVYVGVLPRMDLDRAMPGDLDLTGLAFPTKIAQDVGVFGPAMQFEYCGDFRSYQVMMPHVGYRQRAGVVAGHF